MGTDICGIYKCEDCHHFYCAQPWDQINKCYRCRQYDAMTRMAKYIGRVTGANCPRWYSFYDGLNCQEICNMPGRRREDYFYQCWIDYFMNGEDLKEGAIYHFFHVDIDKEWKRPSLITIILNGEGFEYNLQDEDLLSDILKDFFGETVTIDRRMNLIGSP